jgi:hypothetical protein
MKIASFSQSFIAFTVFYVEGVMNSDEGYKVSRVSVSPYIPHEESRM